MKFRVKYSKKFKQIKQNVFSHKMLNLAQTPKFCRREHKIYANSLLKFAFYFSFSSSLYLLSSLNSS